MNLALYQRLRKHLKKKMSEEEVDEKMNKLADDDDDEELKKLAEEADEEDKKKLEGEDDKDKKKMSEDEDEEEKEKHLSRLVSATVTYKGKEIHADTGAGYGAVTIDGSEIKSIRGVSLNDAVAKAKKYIDENNLTAARASITRLSTDFRSKRDSAKLATKIAAVNSRLSAIRSSGRITPAEVKKIDLKNLAGKSQESIDAVMKSYEDRQPVILVGQLGSMKAMSMKEIEKETKAVRLSRLETETRANMSLLRHTVDEKRLADGVGSPDEVNIHIDTDPHTDLSSMENDYNSVCKMMDEGKIQEAKDQMKLFMDRMKKMGGYGMAEPSMHETSMEQLAALTADIDQLSAKFDEAIGLVESLASGAQ